MTEGSDDGTNVVPFSRRGATIDADAAAVDKDVEAALWRSFEAIQQRTAPSEQKPLSEDAKAIESESAFKARFGFDAPRHRRQQTLALKHDADLTDREIRLLQRFRCLAFTGKAAEISAPVYLAMWGYLQIGAVAILMLCTFAVALGSTQPAHIVAAKLAGAEGLMLGFAVAIAYQFVWPYKLLKRTRFVVPAARRSDPRPGAAGPA